VLIRLLFSRCQVSLLCSCEVYLGRSPKVKESIEGPFKNETWLGDTRVELHVRVQGTTTA
jgi:hypothetical protein